MRKHQFGVEWLPPLSREGIADLDRCEESHYKRTGPMELRRPRSSGSELPAPSWTHVIVSPDRAAVPSHYLHGYSPPTDAWLSWCTFQKQVVDRSRQGGGLRGATRTRAATFRSCATPDRMVTPVSDVYRVGMSEAQEGMDPHLSLIHI